jgi:diguanylate cyclase (GGDEF)-like protein
MSIEQKRATSTSLDGTNTEEAVTPPSMNDLFVDPRVLPAPPVAVLEIMRRADDPDVALPDIVTLIESEVSIAVQVLRMANSALYSPAKDITTISRAMTTLGLRTIRMLALTTSLRALIPQDSHAVDTAEIRLRMVLNGALARRVAELVDPTVRDEAFLTGLLSGIGPVVLADRSPETCATLTAPDNRWPSPERERELLGYTVDDVTAGLIEQWGLPVMFGQAIRRRSERPDASDSPLEVSAKAGLLAERVLTRRDAGVALPELRSLLEQYAGLSSEDVDQWLVDAEPVVEETAGLLQFRLPHDVGYSELLLEASERMHALQLSMDQRLFGGEAAVGELARRNNELELEVVTDPLTQLPNRRALDHRLSELLIESSTGSLVGGRGLGVLMLDLDRFKTVNDTWGHGVGDDVLRLVGALLLRQTRGDDFAGRMGGEEFVMLIPNTTRHDLYSIAERIRLAVADLALPLDNGDVVKVTASIGGALVDDHPVVSSARELLEMADQQLYDAKRRGRNCSNVR